MEWRRLWRMYFIGSASKRSSGGQVALKEMRDEHAISFRLAIT
jgi:hypothetical protein